MLVVIAAPGGYGKDTVARRLCEEDPRFVVSRSWTTRPPRPGEPPDTYTYVDRETFEKRIAEGGFLEWAEYHGNLYGTPTPDPSDDRHLVLTIELQGALNVLAMDPDAFMILLELSSPEIQIERMRQRGDDEEAIRRRAEAAFEELAEGRKIAHATVLNDDLTQAVAEVRRILANRLSGEMQTPNG